MKEKILKFLEYLFNIKDIILTVAFIAGSAGGFITGFFMRKVTLSIWQIILLIIIPWMYYGLIVRVNGRMKRRFNTGDMVSIVADERKFVMVRYSFWFPQYAICKEYNKDHIVMVHQKYLVNYIEPTKPDPLSMFGYPNINKAVPTATLTRL